MFAGRPAVLVDSSRMSFLRNSADSDPLDAMRAIQICGRNR